MKNPIVQAGLRLGLFALVLLSAVSLAYLAARERIAVNQREALLQRFRELGSDDPFPPDFLARRQNLTLAGQPVQLFRSRYVYLQSRTPRGYGGDIDLLLAIDGQRLLGVRVLAHRETPGLGDQIEAEKSDWIQSFAGRTAATNFNVKKDGGDFDAFTGATFSHRAGAQQVGLVFIGWLAHEKTH